MATNIVEGSVQDLATRQHSMVDAIAAVDAVALVDTSGSMDVPDARDGQTRHRVACQELARVQREQPGRLLVIAFSSEAEVIPGGEPPYSGGSTNLTAALQLAWAMDRPGLQIIVVSDGCPNNPESALGATLCLQADVSTVYVGPQGGEGMHFMRRLARDGGGRALEAHHANALFEATQTLLPAEAV